MKKFVWALMAAAAIFAISCNKNDDTKKDKKGGDEPDVEKDELVTGDSQWSVIGNFYGDGWTKDLSGVDKADGWAVISYLEVEATSEFKVRKDKTWNGGEPDNNPDFGHSFGLNEDGAIELNTYVDLGTRAIKDGEDAGDTKNIKINVTEKTYIDFYMKANGDKVTICAVEHGAALPAAE